ncbi:lipopolysaccharide assembly protein LapB [Salinisphaera sp. Q1T1-3]|uniref:lipopolysaccharide assembly protein LapB n=1 Tax=Salinisphaera sp. Q1T1-3 TaxID=2321229 RepID=UPI000E7547F9|nr:lipopolysaccharide assembly protein LapB [Salinisphaera sp. Q1T1-3]RJS92679.1 lipopolysaccharide assembly protein LapB [Salinisphaera sp. Q1T1-3]
MPDAIVWVVMLLPIAAASGWWARARAERQRTEGTSANTNLQNDYLQGIRHLVNNDANRAIETFSRVLEVDDETVETHLALGDLFRRQGDIDRALRLHQNLVARPNLAKSHRDQARFELAQDYLRAGVLDRAEDLFNELAAHPEHADRSLAGLLTIHEQTREWAHASDVAERLARLREVSLRPAIAQYFCELACERLEHADDAGARAALRRAEQASRDCARTSLIEGAWLAARDEHRHAIRAYRRVLSQDIAFAAEILEPVSHCYDALSDQAGLLKFLDWFIDRASIPLAHVAKAKTLDSAGRTDEAIAHLSRYLQTEASWRAFSCLLELSAADPRTRLSGPLDSLRASLTHIIARAPTHRCGHCGFASRYLHWQCPSCRQWNRMTPIDDIRPDAQ